MPPDISYIKAGYRGDRWKWVLSLPNRDKLLNDKDLIAHHIDEKLIFKTYGLDKVPKQLPCMKKCTSNPWCLSDMKNKEGKKKLPPTESPRNEGTPVGLQNTAYTCWINSALQSLYHIFRFRNGINSIDNFEGDSSLNSLAYLLQAIFIEIERTKYAALPCTNGSFFEKLAIFATREILQEDQDSEVLKCVSEFLENSIDKLIGDPRSGSIFAPMFKIHLYRLAQWCCPSCQKDHQEQMSTETICTMAAYVHGDECPLSQCILDLQTNVQTGVSLLCREEKGGCGKTVLADRTVIPKILELPDLLIIRNNSLADSGNRKRQHVVFPEILDLADYSCGQKEASYNLRSVIFHHGSWVKHFTAHVKTEDGSWYNFNDEFVTGLVGRSSSIPLENNPNYLSLADVAAKFKGRTNVRVSRGAFIWIYEKNSTSKPSLPIPPPNKIINYILSKQHSGQMRDEEKINFLQKQRTEMLIRLSVSNKRDNTSIISRHLLSSWATSEEDNFTLMPSLLKNSFCEHGKYDPMVINNIKCLRTIDVCSLMSDSCGILRCSQFRPTVIPTLQDGLCSLCIVAHAHHIIFRERLKELYYKCKKEYFKEFQSDCTFIGKRTLECWPQLAASTYLTATQIGEKLKLDLLQDDNEEINIDEISKEESIDDPVSSIGSTSMDNQAETEEAVSDINGIDNCSQDNLFNWDIVCPHNLRDPEAAGFWIPNSVTDEIIQLCSDKMHPAVLQSDFDICPDCQRNYNQSRAVIERGMKERTKFYQLYLERKRPHPTKEAGSKIFLLARQFYSEWKSYIKACEKENLISVTPPKDIDNSSLICQHEKLILPELLLAHSLISRYCVLLKEEEWEMLKESYSSNYVVGGILLHDGSISSSLSVCEHGCAQRFQTQVEEEKFAYSNGLIYIRQVNSVDDIPLNSDFDEPLPKRQRNCPKSFDDSSPSRMNKRLIRASRAFSSTDTMKDVQNYIAERTGIWPLLQTLWLGPSLERGPEPLLINDRHRNVTLSALRVKAQDTIYFRALKSDLEKAAGNGIVEFDEMDEF